MYLNLGLEIGSFSQTKNQTKPGNPHLAKYGKLNFKIKNKRKIETRFVSHVKKKRKKPWGGPGRVEPETKVGGVAATCLLL